MACGFSNLATSPTSLLLRDGALGAQHVFGGAHEGNRHHVDACFNPNSGRLRSLSVREGILTFVPGRLMP